MRQSSRARNASFLQFTFGFMLGFTQRTCKVDKLSPVFNLTASKFGYGVLLFDISTTTFFTYIDEIDISDVISQTKEIQFKNE